MKEISCKKAAKCLFPWEESAGLVIDHLFIWKTLVPLVKQQLIFLLSTAQTGNMVLRANRQSKSSC